MLRHFANSIFSPQMVEQCTLISFYLFYLWLSSLLPKPHKGWLHEDKSLNIVLNWHQLSLRSYLINIFESNAETQRNKKPSEVQKLKQNVWFNIIVCRLLVDQVVDDEGKAGGWEVAIENGNAILKVVRELQVWVQIKGYNKQIDYLLEMYRPLPLFESTPSKCFDATSETSTQGEDAEFHHEGLSQQMAPLYSGGSSKAKSSLCKNFTEKGFCPYGSKCQFAHGPHELRINMEHNRSYKTKGCHAFAKKGYCCYGDRCNFKHERGSLENLKEKWSNIYSNHRDTFFCIFRSEGSQLMRMLEGKM